MARLNVIDWIAVVLAIVGAINWGLIGLFGFNLVNALFGWSMALENAIYVIVGLAGLWLIYTVVRITSQEPFPTR